MRIINKIITETIDNLTGEVISSSNVITYKKPQITKKFSMISRDERWTRRIKPIDLYLLVELLEYENANKFVITVNKTVRDELKSFIKISDSQITLSLKNMIANDVLKRVGRSMYMINPECVWSGSVKTQEERIDKYMSH